MFIKTGNKGIKMVLVITVMVCLISILITGCNLNDEEASDEITSNDQVIKNDVKEVVESIDDENNFDVENNNVTETETENDDDDVGDFTLEDNTYATEDDTYYEGSMFGNRPYTEACIIEYYLQEPSVGEIYTFNKIYGLHVDGDKLLAMEDIILVELTTEENHSEAEKEKLLEDMLKQMEAANFSRINGQEVIVSFNGKEESEVVSFAYYIHDPELGKLTDYTMYVSYFNQSGFIQIK